MPAVPRHFSQCVAPSPWAVRVRQPRCTAEASKQTEPDASSKAPTDNHQEKPFYSPFTSQALAGITTSACNWPRHENKTSHRARSALNMNTSAPGNESLRLQKSPHSVNIYLRNPERGSLG